MKKFMSIYNASNDVDSNDAWMSWFTAITPHIADMGSEFNGGKIVTSEGARDITEWSDFVGGYTLISAPDMDAAVELAKGCPNKAGVRVFESMNM